MRPGTQNCRVGVCCFCCCYCCCCFCCRRYSIALYENIASIVEQINFHFISSQLIHLCQLVRLLYSPSSDTLFTLNPPPTQILCSVAMRVLSPLCIVDDMQVETLDVWLMHADLLFLNRSDYMKRYYHIISVAITGHFDTIISRLCTELVYST